MVAIWRTALPTAVSVGTHSSMETSVLITFVSCLIVVFLQCFFGVLILTSISDLENTIIGDLFEEAERNP